MGLKTASKEYASVATFIRDESGNEKSFVTESAIIGIESMLDSYSSGSTQSKHMRMEPAKTCATRTNMIRKVAFIYLTANQKAMAEHYHFLCGILLYNRFR